MRIALALCVFASLFQVLPAEGRTVIPQSEYQARRKVLRGNLKGVFVAFGRSETADEQLRTGFFQEPYFYYLTGWTEPDAVAILTKDEEEVFLPPRDDRYERYYGHRISAADPDAVERTGFQKILARSELERELFRLLGGGKRVEFLRPEPQATLLRQVLALRPQVSVEDVTKLVDAQREVKSPNELAILQESADASVKAHEAAFRAVAPKMYEFQIAAVMQKVWEDRGCERRAYAPIVASGPNAVVLHYSADKRQVEPGDLVVIDAGSECSYYAADITRTLPAVGRFTARQREIYDIVLGAQRAAIDAVKPGMVIGRKDTNGSLMQIAYNYMDTHGRDLHGDRLGKYVLHGLSHHIGLEVHDPGDIMEPLKPGMVISIEPGIYIREESLGIRVEDMIVVTETGHRVLTENLPKDAEAIESRMQAH
jgi:Xaa-Pro aminopeptidase